jgi:hypothetical protein
MRVVGVAAGLVVFASSCLEPTQVKLVITTDICDLTNVSIYLDDPTQPLATIPRKLGCPHDLGSLVFIPSGNGTRFTVHVDGSRRGDGLCTTDCVKASRSVSYVSHASLTLPVELESACVNISCPVGKTCRRGKCVDADAKCDKAPNLCDIPDDGGIVDLDTGLLDALDVPCPGVGASGRIISAGTALNSWTFDEFLGDFKDGIGASPVSLGTGYTRLGLGGRCRGGLELGGAGMSMPLGTAVATKGVGVVMDVRVPSTGGSFTLVGANPGQQYGWQIVGNDSNGSWALTVAVQSNTTTGYAASQIFTKADGNWHHIEVIGSGFVVTFLVDNAPMGEPVAIKPQVSIPSGMLPLFLTGSSTQKVAIDNLWIYSSK